MALFSLIAIFAAVLIAPVVGRWVFRPLVSCFDEIKAPRRFLLSDLIWLMLQLQVGIAVAMQFFDRNVPNSWRALILLAICVVVFAIWWGGLHVVSYAGISQPIRRAAVILIVIPVGIALATAPPIVVALYLGSLPWEDSPISSVWRSELWLAGPLLIMGVVVGKLLHLVAEWAVRGNRSACDDSVETP